MSLRFREDKAAQAAARLARREGGSINHMKLIKLLYLADRASLVRWGRPITYDWYFSLDHGPVLSLTMDCINSEPDPDNPSYWHELFSERRGNSVSLVMAVPPNDQLSPAEEKLLDQIFEEFGAMDQWQLRDFTHTLPEWRDPKGSRLPIEIRDILLASGMTEEEAREVTQVLEGESSARYELGE